VLAVSKLSGFPDALALPPLLMGIEIGFNQGLLADSELSV